MPAHKDDLSTPLFLALALLLSACFWALMIWGGHVGAGGGHYVGALMGSPGVATIWLRRLDTRSLAFSTIGGVYSVVGYLAPLAYAEIAYGLVWGLGLGSFPDPASVEKNSSRLGRQPGDSTSFVIRYFLPTAATGIIFAVRFWLARDRAAS